MFMQYTGILDKWRRNDSAMTRYCCRTLPSDGPRIEISSNGVPAFCLLHLVTRRGSSAFDRHLLEIATEGFPTLLGSMRLLPDERYLRLDSRVHCLKFVTIGAARADGQVRFLIRDIGFYQALPLVVALTSRRSRTRAVKWVAAACRSMISNTTPVALPPGQSDMNAV
jgi:hypothetical protein